MFVDYIVRSFRGSAPNREKNSLEFSILVGGESSKGLSSKIQIGKSLLNAHPWIFYSLKNSVHFEPPIGE